jgi:hypothetical protein
MNPTQLWLLWQAILLPIAVGFARQVPGVEPG